MEPPRAEEQLLALDRESAVQRLEYPARCGAFEVCTRVSFGAMKRNLTLAGLIILAAAVAFAQTPRVTFAIAGIPGAPTFRAKVGPDFAKDGTLSGQFTQGPGTFPFTLKRASTEEKAKAALEDFVAAAEAIFKAHKAPGAGIAIVKNDTVVFSCGIGLRNLETRAKVTRDTLFAIGSSTKAFTALSRATTARRTIPALL